MCFCNETLYTSSVSKAVVRRSLDVETIKHFSHTDRLSHMGVCSVSVYYSLSVHHYFIRYSFALFSSLPVHLLLHILSLALSYHMKNVSVARLGMVLWVKHEHLGTSAYTRTHTQPPTQGTIKCSKIFDFLLCYQTNHPSHHPLHLLFFANGHTNDSVIESVRSPALCLSQSGSFLFK